MTVFKKIGVLLGSSLKIVSSITWYAIVIFMSLLILPFAISILLCGIPCMFLAKLADTLNEYVGLGHDPIIDSE